MLICVDLDGTLLDSLWVWSEVDEVFLSRRGLPILPDYAQSIAHLGFADAARYTIDRFGLDETPEQLMQEWYDLARAAYRDRVPLKPHAEEFLRKLCAQGVHISACGLRGTRSRYAARARSYHSCMSCSGVSSRPKRSMV